MLPYGELGWGTDPDEKILPLVGCFFGCPSPCLVLCVFAQMVVHPMEGENGGCFCIWFGLLAVALAEVQVILLLCYSCIFYNLL